LNMKGLKNNIYLRAVLIFVVFFSIFFLGHLLKQGFWSTDDPYYHAKHSALIVQTGNLTLVRPWLEFHFLNYAPNDPWWGFHLWQAAFIYFFGVFLGVKIAAALLAGLFFAVFYFILKKFSVPYPFVWVYLIFISSSYFFFRISVERPQILGIIILPLFSYFLVEKKYYLMFCLAALFAIFYHFFLSLFLLIFFYWLVEYYQERKVNLKPFIFTGLGVLAGILIHPNSLNYLFVVFVHSAEVLYLKFTGVNLGVGVELYPSALPDFIFNNFLIFVPFCLAIVLFLGVKRINQNRKMIFYFLISIFWFLVSLVVIRGADYWIPFGWLFIALVFEEFSQSEEWPCIKNLFRRRVNLRVTAFFFFSFILFVSLYNITENFFIRTWEGNRNLSTQYVADANNWLKKNTPSGSIIFYDDWSLWPMMFFYNDHNRYITGMDPTFLYEYDHRLSWIWKNISYYGLYCDKPGICLEIGPRDNIRLAKAAIKDMFRSDYIFLENRPEHPLAKLLAADRKDFTKVFGSQGILIYKITP